MKRAPFSLYVHIPYCMQKCPYCDFNTYAVPKVPEEDYGDALLSELDYFASQPEWQFREIQTVYFGGGTPSLFHPDFYRKFFKILHERFRLQNEAEVTLEANPGMLDSEKLDGFLESGVNRLSLGAQSFSEKTLERLGRIHTPDQIRSSIEQARISGFKNISVDLIFGVPDQSFFEFQGDVVCAAEAGVEHISAYSLTYEKGTPFYKARSSGALKPLSEDLVAKMMSSMIVEFRSRGFRHYEISNFAKPGFESRHNTAYWKRDDYLGLGAGAHSFYRDSNDRALRWSNYALPAEYMNQTTAFGKALSWSDALKKRDLIFEFFFLGLRNLSGVSLRLFEDEFEQKVEKEYGSLIQDLVQEDLLERENDIVKLSPRGVMISDSIIEQFALS